MAKKKTAKKPAAKRKAAPKRVAKKPSRAKRAPAPKRKPAPKRVKRAAVRVAPAMPAEHVEMMEVAHLPDAIGGVSAPEKGTPVEVETAHAHVEMEHAHHASHAHHAADAQPAAPQEPTHHTLTVRVRDWFSKIVNREVVLTSGDTVVARQTTNDRGEVAFAGLVPGEYKAATTYRGEHAKVVKLAKDRTITLRFW